MCGRFTFSDPASFYARFGIALAPSEQIAPRFNVSPSQEIPTVVEGPDGRALRWMQWGFRPGWLKPKPGQPPPINARAETLLERSMFRGAIPGHRCIIPADGFYEWQAVPGRRRKQPMYIRLKDGGLFGFAGIYTERNGDLPDETRVSCAIITTAPNELMESIHNRMPVILDPDDEALWLDPSGRDPAAVMPCLRPYPAGRMEAFAVSDLVSSVHNDRPALIEPLTES